MLDKAEETKIKKKSVIHVGITMEKNSLNLFLISFSTLINSRCLFSFFEDDSIWWKSFQATGSFTQGLLSFQVQPVSAPGPMQGKAYKTTKNFCKNLKKVIF